MKGRKEQNQRNGTRASRKAVKLHIDQTVSPFCFFLFRLCKVTGDSRHKIACDLEFLHLSLLGKDPK